MEQEYYEYEVIPEAVSGLMHSAALLCCLLWNASVVIVIVIVIYRTPKLHTPSCIFMLALATEDMMLAFIWNITPLALMSQPLREMLPVSWSCYAIGFSWQTMMTTSALLQAAIAFDRYVFIVHPYKYQIHMTNKRAALCCGLVLLVACALPVAFVLQENSYRFIPATMTCSGPTMWPILVLVIIFVPSFTLSIFSYHRVWKLCSNALKHSPTIPEHRASHRGTGIKTNRQDEITGPVAQKDESGKATVSPPKLPSSLVDSNFSPLAETHFSAMETMSNGIQTKKTTVTTSLAESQVYDELNNHNPDRIFTVTANQTLTSPIGISLLVKEPEENYTGGVNVQIRAFEKKTSITATSLRGPSGISDISIPMCSDGALTLPHLSTKRSSKPSILSLSSAECTFKINFSESPSPVLTSQEPQLLNNTLNHLVLPVTPLPSRGIPSRKPSTKAGTDGVTVLHWMAVYNPILTWMFVQDTSEDTVLQNSLTSLDKTKVKPVNPFLSGKKFRRLKASFVVGLPLLGMVAYSVVFHCL